jgi:hypothetical protein
MKEPLFIMMWKIFAIFVASASFTILSFYFNVESQTHRLANWRILESSRHSELKDNGEVIYIDARPAHKYHSGNLAEAIMIDALGWDAGTDLMIKRWTPGVPIIVYGDADSRALTIELARRLSEISPEFEVRLLKLNALN